MISLITGLPGTGKTLFALWYIKQKAEKENREVYYHNIKDLTLPWEAFEAEKWMDLPHGSIIVMDECQFVFSKKPNGSKLPDFYEQLATHRHRGHDIYLITQHPSLIDNFVRQLVGQHYHGVRKFGLERSTIYEWSSVNPAPTSSSSQKAAIPMKWAFPKEVYGYYKSAEVHTVKRSIPMKVVLAVLFIFFVVIGCYWMLDRFQHRGDKATVQEVAQVSSVDGARQVASSSGSGDGKRRYEPGSQDDAQYYIAMQQPRIVGLPQSAPKYDELTKPSRVPVPAACIQIGSVRDQRGIRCKCYSQDGTPMNVELNMCIKIAQEGVFLDFNPDPNRQSQSTLAASEAPTPSRPIVPASVPQNGSQVVQIGSPEPVPTVGSGKKSDTVQDGPPSGKAARADFSAMPKGGAI
jgi:zona occludens toxin